MFAADYNSTKSSINFLFKITLFKHMKKLALLLSFCMVAVFISLISCQKENAMTSTEPTASQGATERDGPITPPDPCRQETVFYGTLAEKKAINTGAFNTGWKAGVLDFYANDCILGNKYPPNCNEGGVACFYGLPAFQLSNFKDFATGNVTPANQTLIVNMALSYAQSHISCDGGNTPTIYQIDFSLFPSGAFWGEEVEFAVRYLCCPNKGGSTE